MGAQRRGEKQRTLRTLAAGARLTMRFLGLLESETLCRGKLANVARRDQSQMRGGGGERGAPPGALEGLGVLGLSVGAGGHRVMDLSDGERA